MTREEKNQNDRDNYWYLKSMHICVQCGTNPAEPNITRCYECNQKHREYSNNLLKSMTSEQKEKYLKQHREAARKRYEYLKRKGLCVDCGKYISVKGKTLCIECRNRRNRKNKNGIQRSERTAYGLCYICGKDLESDCKKLCSECSERSIKNFKSCTGATPKHTWRKQNQTLFMRKVEHHNA